MCSHFDVRKNCSNSRKIFRIRNRRAEWHWEADTKKEWTKFTTRARVWRACLQNAVTQSTDPSRANSYCQRLGSVGRLVCRKRSWNATDLPNPLRCALEQRRNTELLVHGRTEKLFHFESTLDKLSGEFDVDVEKRSRSRTWIQYSTMSDACIA